MFFLCLHVRLIYALNYYLLTYLLRQYYDVNTFNGCYRLLKIVGQCVCVSVTCSVSARWRRYQLVRRSVWFARHERLRDRRLKSQSLHLTIQCAIFLAAFSPSPWTSGLDVLAMWQCSTLYNGVRIWCIGSCLLYYHAWPIAKWYF